MKIQAKTSPGFIAGRFHGGSIQRLKNCTEYAKDVKNGEEYEFGFVQGYIGSKGLSREEIENKKSRFDDYGKLGLVEGIEARNTDEKILSGFKLILNSAKSFLFNTVIQKFIDYARKVSEKIWETLKWIGLQTDKIRKIIEEFIIGLPIITGVSQEIGSLLTKIIKTIFSKFLSVIGGLPTNFSSVLLKIAYSLMDDLGLIYPNIKDILTEENQGSSSGIYLIVLDSLCANPMSNSQSEQSLGEIIFFYIWSKGIKYCLKNFF